MGGPGSGRKPEGKGKVWHMEIKGKGNRVNYAVLTDKQYKSYKGLKTPKEKKSFIRKSLKMF